MQNNNLFLYAQQLIDNNLKCKYLLEKKKQLSKEIQMAIGQEEAVAETTYSFNCKQNNNAIDKLVKCQRKGVASVGTTQIGLYPGWIFSLSKMFISYDKYIQLLEYR